jgi:hypothetical protein
MGDPSSNTIDAEQVFKEMKRLQEAVQHFIDMIHGLAKNDDHALDLYDAVQKINVSAALLGQAAANCTRQPVESDAILEALLAWMAQLYRVIEQPVPTYSAAVVLYKFLRSSKEDTELLVRRLTGQPLDSFQ